MNHRMGLFDQILIKDNHVDYAGSMARGAGRRLDHLSTGPKGARGGGGPGPEELKEALMLVV